MAWQPHALNDTKILELVRDASRFARVFARTIEEHPLLVYLSALPFIPTTSALYRTYHDADIYPSVLGGSQNSWTPLLLVMPSYMKGVNSVGFSPDGTRIVSGSEDNIIRVWNSITGAEVLEMRGHRNRVTSVAFSPDGCQIVSGSYDKTVRVWNCTTGAEVLSVSRDHEEVIAVAFSPDGKSIASGSRNATVQILDAITGAEVSVLRGHEEAIYSLAFSPNGRTLVSGSRDKTIRVWDVITSSIVSEMRGHHSAIEAVNFSPDGGRIVSGSWDESIRVWNAITGTEIHPAMQGHVDGVQSVAFSPDGNKIVSGSLDATIRIWDVATGVEIRSLQGHNHYVCSVNFSPDGTKIVSGSWDDTIRVWDATVGAEAPPISRMLDDHMHSTLHELLHDVYSIAFSPDGTKIVSGSNDPIIRLWDSTTGAIVSKIRGHESSVLSVNFSPDGSRLVSGSLDMTVRVWNATTGAQIFNELRGHPQGVHCVAFSLDGSRILSKSRLRCISWDAETGCQLRSIKESGYPVFRSIRITRDKWVIHSLTGRAIYKLPPLASTSSYVSHHSSLAVRTDHGQVFVMHLPPTLLTSSETRLVEGKGRLLGISEEENVFSEEEEFTSEAVHKRNQTVGLFWPKISTRSPAVLKTFEE
jgi:WD40 repeat protein